MMKGRRSNSKLVPFGETVQFQIPKTEKKIEDFEDRWEQGIWCDGMLNCRAETLDGHHPRNGVGSMADCRAEKLDMNY